MRNIRICVTAALLVSPIGSAEAMQQRPSNERVRAALELPSIVDSVRRRGGIPERDVRVVLDDARRRRIPAADTRDVLKQTDESIKEHGPVNNFGAFVQGRLAAGQRGQTLAQSIRAEHARRGIGKGKRVGLNPAATGPAAASSQKQNPGSTAKGSTKSPTKGAAKAPTKSTKTPTKSAAKTTTTKTKTPPATKTPTKTPTKTKARP